MRALGEIWKGSLLVKNVPIAIAFAVGCLAVAAPIIISLWLAEQESFAEQTDRADQIAIEVLRHADQTARQLIASVRRLERGDAGNPCSNNNILRMARIAVAADQLQALGYVSGNRLVCSSFGRYDPGVDIGPPEFQNTRSGIFRTEVVLPDVPGVKFILITHASSGYTAIIHPDLALNIFVDNPNVSIGIFSVSQQKSIDSRGTFDPRWVQMLGSHYSADLTTDDNIVAVRRSGIGDYGAFAEISAVSRMASLRRFAIVLVPLGVAAGIALALAVVYLARLQLGLPAVLRTALRRNEFFIEYQPVMDLNTGRWCGAEALIRWLRPDGERVRPEVFIPVAEETGLITRITERALEIVADEAVALFDRYPDFHISVNLSAADFGSDRILGHLHRLALTTKAGTGHFVVEVTERSLVKGEMAKRLLHDMRAAGFRVAIDDFGTGYSSLSYLQTLEADFLKIDKSFVDTIGTDAATNQVVYHIIEMAKGLNLGLIAEGVETNAQLEFLYDHGVRYVQGWLFAKPMPMTRLISEMAAVNAV